MILLDTNVISEPLRASPDLNVLAWIDAQVIETLYLSTICLAELRFGIAVLDDGKRKQMLHKSLEQQVLPLFDGRILTFDDWQLPLLMVILLQLHMPMAFLWLHVIFTHLKLLEYQSSTLGITANRSL